MDISYELYTDDDYIDLKNMILHLYQEDPEGEPMNDGKIDDTIREYKINPNKLKIYMFKIQGKNIGYAILVYFWSNEYGGNIITIDELYVEQTQRGRRVSTDFLSYLEKRANKIAIQLEVTPSNQRVMDYYRRLGFVPCQNTHLLKIN